MALYTFRIIIIIIIHKERLDVMC